MGEAYGVLVQEEVGNPHGAPDSSIVSSVGPVNPARRLRPSDSAYAFATARPRPLCTDEDRDGSLRQNRSKRCGRSSTPRWSEVFEIRRHPYPSFASARMRIAPAAGL